MSRAAMARMCVIGPACSVVRIVSSIVSKSPACDEICLRLASLRGRTEDAEGGNEAEALKWAHQCSVSAHVAGDPVGSRRLFLPPRIAGSSCVCVSPCKPHPSPASGCFSRCSAYCTSASTLQVARVRQAGSQGRSLRGGVAYRAFGGAGAFSAALNA